MGLPFTLSVSRGVPASERTRVHARTFRTMSTTLALMLGLSGSMFGQVPGFSDQTDAAGITNVHNPAALTPGLPMHAGGTVGDFNNDDLPDLFVVNGGLDPDRLFINNGDGTFTDMADSAGLTDVLFRGVGATAGDYDGDGDIDIFVTSMGDMPMDPTAGQHKLFRNNGDLTFTDVAVSAGVNETAPYPDGYGCAFGDYDLDSDLDLFVCGWHKDENLENQGNRLFENNGDGTFTDVTVSAGVYVTDFQGFSPVFCDVNGDRYPELLVAADFGTTHYFLNNRDGTFTAMDFVMDGSETVEAGMGQTTGDFNRDGKMDWFITAIYPGWHGQGPSGNRLYMNEGNDDQFSALPESAGVNDAGWAWGTSALDFDHDMRLDIAVANGWAETCDTVTGECFTGEPVYLFQNDGNDTFTEVGSLYGLDFASQGRCLVTFDYDVDGDMDIVAFSNRDSLKLYRNDLSGSNTNWLELRLDTSGNPALAPNGFGTRIIAFGGGVPQAGYIDGGSHYLGRSQLVAHFGLAGVATVDNVVVEWMDGFRTVLHDVAANQVLEVAAELPYSHDPLIRGTMVDLTVNGVKPGETVYFLASVTGMGAGPCYSFLGDLCLDILQPFLIGTVVADSEGTAILTLTVPVNPNITTTWTQAVIRRGPGGITSFKSNAIEGEFIDP